MASPVAPLAKVADKKQDALAGATGGDEDYNDDLDDVDRFIRDKTQELVTMYKEKGGVDNSYKLKDLDDRRTETRKLLKRLSSDKRNEKRRAQRVMGRCRKLQNESLVEMLSNIIKLKERRQKKPQHTCGSGVNGKK